MGTTAIRRTRTHKFEFGHSARAHRKYIVHEYNLYAESDAMLPTMLTRTQARSNAPHTHTHAIWNFRNECARSAQGLHVRLLCCKHICVCALVGRDRDRNA